MEEQRHASTIGTTNTLEEGTLVALQEVPDAPQVMKIFPHSIVAVNSFYQCGDLVLHDQESNLITTIEKLGCTVLCNMETLKKESNHHYHEPLLEVGV